MVTTSVMTAMEIIMMTTARAADDDDGARNENFIYTSFTFLCSLREIDTLFAKGDNEDGAEEAIVMGSLNAAATCSSLMPLFVWWYFDDSSGIHLMKKQQTKSVNWMTSSISRHHYILVYFFRWAFKDPSMTIIPYNLNLACRAYN